MEKIIDGIRWTLRDKRWHGEWSSPDGDGVRVDIEEDGFTLFCFSGIPSSHIHIDSIIYKDIFKQKPDVDMILSWCNWTCAFYGCEREKYIPKNKVAVLSYTKKDFDKWVKTNGREDELYVFVSKIEHAAGMVFKRVERLYGCWCIEDFPNVLDFVSSHIIEDDNEKRM